MFLVRVWDPILQIALIVWIVRVPVIMTGLGLLLLGLAPQAQDLFVEFARLPTWRMFLFVVVMVFVWTLPTHYAARLLLDTDERFQKLLFLQREKAQNHILEAITLFVPRFLGVLTF